MSDFSMVRLHSPQVSDFQNAATAARVSVAFVVEQGDDGPELVAEVQERRPGALPLSYRVDVPALQALIPVLRDAYGGQFRPTPIGWEWVRSGKEEEL